MKKISLFHKHFLLIAGLVLALPNLCAELQPGELHPEAEAKRFIRGTTTNPGNHTFVLPLSFQKGVQLDDVGDNTAKFDGSAPWIGRVEKYSRVQWNGLNQAWDIPFDNPIATFGSAVGGTALYTGESWRFGTYTGRIVDYPDNLTFIIWVYDRADSEPSTPWGPDWWEMHHFTSVSQNQSTVFDEDGATDGWEWVNGLDPKVDDLSGDLDGSPNNEDARPNDDQIGAMAMTIASHIHGSTM